MCDTESKRERERERERERDSLGKSTKVHFFGILAGFSLNASGIKVVKETVLMVYMLAGKAW
jgi:hypothetical protein